MSSHQIDLELGESIEVGGHNVTVHRIDDELQQAVLEIENPDGSIEMVSIDVVSLRVTEPALV